MNVYNQLLAVTTLMMLTAFLTLRFDWGQKKATVLNPEDTEKRLGKITIEERLLEKSRGKVRKISDLRFNHIREFFDYIEHPTGNCSNRIFFGGNPHILHKETRDGDKVICFDKVFNINPQNCLVYSFGINNEWSFDDAFSKFGCQVFAFDPFMGVADHNRGDRIKFYQIGVSDKDGEVMFGQHNFTVKRFTSILKQLAHLNDTTMIDYLKIDAEGAEIPLLEDMLKNAPYILQKIKQIGMEIHVGIFNAKRTEVFQRNFVIMKQLENLGFKLFSSRRNPIRKYFLRDVGHRVFAYYELVFGLWPENS